MNQNKVCKIQNMGRKIFIFFLFFFLKSAKAGEEISDILPSSRILALYDSEEGNNENNNNLSGIVKKELTKMGFELIPYDIKRGLPDNKFMKDFRAIISGFRDSEMQNARGYCIWIKNQVNNGIKFIILGNFGAYRDSKTKEWLNYEDLNIAFSSIGVQYFANWTDKEENMEIKSLDKEVVKEEKIDLSQIKHYYYFKKVGEIEGHLIIGRKDFSGEESYVIFTGKNGGMALNRYLSADERLREKKKLRINLNLFLKKAIFGERETNPQILIIYDENIPEGRKILQNLRTIKYYSKLNFNKTSLTGATKLHLLDIKKYRTILFVSEGMGILEAYGFKNKITEFLKEGGAIITLLPASPESEGEIYGLEKEEVKNTKSISKIKFFSEEVFPLLTRFIFEFEDSPITALKIKADKNAKVIASSIDGTPFMIENRIGDGKAIYFNSFDLTERFSLGIILQTILYTLKFALVPVYNINVMFVDDYPLPMTNTKREGISTTDTEFYTNVFFPSLMKIAEKYNIHFTFMTIFSYNHNVSPPFNILEFYNANTNASVELGREIIKRGHELGLHGYNHLSPSLSGGKIRDWLDIENIKEGFRVARGEWIKNFGSENLPTTFVPPDNYMDNYGKTALKEIFPEIKIIGSVLVRGEGELEQEVGRDPFISSIINLPRTSSGYFLQGEKLIGMFNGLMLCGVWNHFIHPDDIFDNDRAKGKSFTELINEFTKFIEFTKENFPFLRNMTAREAYIEILKREIADFSYSFNDKEAKITITSGFNFPFYFLVKVEPLIEIKQVKGAKIIYSYKKSGYYIMETFDSNVIIRL